MKKHSEAEGGKRGQLRQSSKRAKNGLNRTKQRIEEI